MKNDELLVKFGARLRELRTEKGLSQEGLGELADVDRTYVSGIERGIRNPSLRNIARLADALGVPLTSLVDRL